MSDTRSSWDPEPAPEFEPRPVVPPPPAPRDPGVRAEPLRLPPLLPRRQAPWMIVEVDETPSAFHGLVWALGEAARREATVVAVAVLDAPAGDPLDGSARTRIRGQLAVHDRLEAQVLRAIAQTGVHGRTRTAVLERPVFDALVAATRGADLVVVGPQGKTLLRPAVPRPHTRRLAHGA